MKVAKYCPTMVTDLKGFKRIHLFRRFWGNISEKSFFYLFWHPQYDRQTQSSKDMKTLQFDFIFITKFLKKTKILTMICDSL